MVAESPTYDAEADPQPWIELASQMLFGAFDQLSRALAHEYAKRHLGRLRVDSDQCEAATNHRAVGNLPRMPYGGYTTKDLGDCLAFWNSPSCQILIDWLDLGHDRAAFIRQAHKRAVEIRREGMKARGVHYSAASKRAA